MHKWRSVQLVEGEKEGGEVRKVVKSHCARQPCGDNSQLKRYYLCQPVMRAVQVSESRKKC